MHSFTTESFRHVSASTNPNLVTVHFTVQKLEGSPVAVMLKQKSDLPFSHLTITPFVVRTTHDIFHDAEWQIGNFADMASFRLGGFIDAIEDNLFAIAQKFVPELSMNDMVHQYDIRRSKDQSIESTRVYLLIGHKDLHHQMASNLYGSLISNTRKCWRNRMSEEND